MSEVGDQYFKAVIAEYEALRKEYLERMTRGHRFFQFGLIFFAAITGWSISLFQEGRPETFFLFFMIVPIVELAFAVLYVKELFNLDIIKSHIIMQIENKINGLEYLTLKDQKSKDRGWAIKSTNFFLSWGIHIIILFLFIVHLTILISCFHEFTKILETIFLAIFSSLSIQVIGINSFWTMAQFSMIIYLIVYICMLFFIIVGLLARALVTDKQDDIYEATMDEESRMHVEFGNGTSGRELPEGANNIRTEREPSQSQEPSSARALK